MSQFEDNLWESVLDRHSDDIAGTTVVTRGRRRTPLLAGATGVLGAAVAAVVLMVGSAASPAPAFAMTVHKQAVSVKIYRQSGIAAANRKLVAMGLPKGVGHVQNGDTVTLVCIASTVSGSDDSLSTYVDTSQGLPSVGTKLADGTAQVVDCSSVAGASSANAGTDSVTTPTANSAG